jgi:threonine/homoserine/homoserine lactone efflux protein
MHQAIVAGAITGYAIALPIGAVAAYLVSLTARTSWRIGVPAAFGVATTDGLYALLAALGGAAVVRVIAPVQPVLNVVAAALLLVVAGLGARRGITEFRQHRNPQPVQPRSSRLTPLRAYGSLILLTAVNPATVVYFAAVVLGNTAISQLPALERVVFAATVFAASASWQVVVALSGAVLGHVVDGARGRLITAVLSSALIVGLAGWTLVS